MKWLAISKDLENLSRWCQVMYLFPRLMALFSDFFAIPLMDIYSKITRTKMFPQLSCHQSRCWNPLRWRDGYDTSKNPKLWCVVISFHALLLGTRTCWQSPEGTSTRPSKLTSHLLLRKVSKFSEKLEERKISRLVLLHKSLTTSLLNKLRRTIFMERFMSFYLLEKPNSLQT